MSIVQVYEMPKVGPFVAVWEYNGNVFSNSFEQHIVGETAEETILLPYNLEKDGYYADDMCNPFFLQYPHKFFINYKAPSDEAE